MYLPVLPTLVLTARLKLIKKKCWLLPE